jgi:hypothetical protein
MIVVVVVPRRAFAATVEHRDIDASVDVAFLERNPVGLVKQI